MEHAFDTLSKNLAGGVSRRESFGLFLRGALGTFFAGLTGRSAKAQSGPCSACGTCQAVDFQTGAVTSCTNQCEAQTLCGQVQSYSPYNLLAATLASYGYQFSSYDAVTTSGSATAAPQAFAVAYTNPNPVNTAGPFGGGTATLNVTFLSGGGMTAMAVAFDSGGNPINAYTVNSSGGIEVIVPPQIPSPFAVSVSPEAVLVAHGSPGTTTVTVAINSPFKSKIDLSASGFPAGAAATFSPSSIPFPGTGSSTMTIRASSAAPTGTYTITITGTGRGVVETAALSVIVEVAAFAADRDEIVEDNSLQARIVAPEIVEPLSKCALCSTFCVAVSSPEVTPLVCAAISTTICLLDIPCAIVLGRWCLGLLPPLCAYWCVSAYCDPPDCTDANCPLPATCQQNVCVGQTCPSGTPCYVQGSATCCPPGTKCCPAYYPAICTAYSCP